MTVKELIRQLEKYPQDAEVQIVKQFKKNDTCILITCDDISNVYLYERRNGGDGDPVVYIE